MVSLPQLNPGSTFSTLLPLSLCFRFDAVSPVPDCDVLGIRIHSGVTEPTWHVLDGVLLRIDHRVLLPGVPQAKHRSDRRGYDWVLYRW